MSASLQVRGVSVHYGGTVALSDVSFAAEPGQVTGLIGPNGAGKTTLMDAIAGNVAYRGSVLIDDQKIDSLSSYRRARKGLSRTFQSTELFDDLSTMENLLVGSFRGSPRGAMREIATVSAPPTPNLVTGLLEEFDLTALAAVSTREISTGNRNLVALARAIASEPRVLLLDEPASGLDSRESVVLGTHIRRLADSGITVLVVEHDMELVLSTCDVIHVLNFGELIASGTPAEIRQDEAVISAYLGTKASTAGGESS